MPYDKALGTLSYKNPPPSLPILLADFIELFSSTVDFGNSSMCCFFLVKFFFKVLTILKSGICFKLYLNTVFYNNNDFFFLIFCIIYKNLRKGHCNYEFSACIQPHN